MPHFCCIILRDSGRKKWLKVLVFTCATNPWPSVSHRVQSICHVNDSNSRACFPPDAPSQTYRIKQIPKPVWQTATGTNSARYMMQMEINSLIVNFFPFCLPLGYKLNSGFVERAPELSCIQRISDQNQQQHLRCGEDRLLSGTLTALSNNWRMLCRLCQYIFSKDNSPVPMNIYNQCSYLW